MPRVVTAGVPMRMPLVMNGLRVSKGMAFLLTVMPASQSSVSSSLARDVLVCQVNKHQVVVRASGNQLYAAIHKALGKCRCIGNDLVLIRIEAFEKASSKHTA